LGGFLFLQVIILVVGQDFFDLIDRPGDLIHSIQIVFPPTLARLAEDFLPKLLFILEMVK